MSEPCDWDPMSHDDDSFALESLIREAGDFVEPSEDLRPRVMEVARAERSERRSRRSLSHWATAVVLAALLGGALDRHFRPSENEPAGAFLGTDADRIYTVASAKRVASGIDFGWCMVEAFAEVRQRQANSLQLND